MLLQPSLKLESQRLNRLFGANVAQSDARRTLKRPQSSDMATYKAFKRVRCHHPSQIDPKPFLTRSTKEITIMIKPVKLRGRQCQCAACGEVFSVTRNFERHRLGVFNATSHNRRCATADEMRTKKLNQDERGVWRAEWTGKPRTGWSTAP